MRRRAFTLLVAAALGAPAAAAAADCGDSVGLVARPGEHAGGVPSQDGRFVAVGSQADGLGGGRPSRWNAVFRIDRAGGAVVRVSPVVAAHADQPSISADGQRIAFTLDAGGSRRSTEVHVYDAATGRSVLASRASGAEGAPAAGDADNPALSADGSRVAFRTTAALDSADTNRTWDVYVRDLRTQETVLVGRTDGPGGAVAERGSSQAAIDADGSRVAFMSAGADGREQVYVRDLAAGTTVLVSQAGGVAGDHNSYAPSIDGSGTRIAFASGADSFGPRSAHLSDVFVRDVARGTTELVSRADGPQGALGDGYSYAPSIDAAGTAVAFESTASNLAGPPSPRGVSGPARVRVYVRSLEGQDTTFIAHTAKRPALSGDGRALVYSSLGATGVWRIVAAAASGGGAALVASGADPEPNSSIARLRTRSVVGRATRAARVQVAIARATSRCPRLAWRRARGARRFSYRLPRGLRPGRYVVYSRAVGADGVVETTYGRVTFTVRASSRRAP